MTGAGRNFIILVALAMALLAIDYAMWRNGGITWSETIWIVNQHTLAVAFGVGMVCGHLFTVPGGDMQIRNLIEIPQAMAEAPTRRGYVNFVELKKVVVWSNVGQYLLASVLLPILQAHSKWLAEPWDSMLGPFFALLVALLGARLSGVKFLKRG